MAFGKHASARVLCAAAGVQAPFTTFRATPHYLYTPGRLLFTNGTGTGRTGIWLLPAWQFPAACWTNRRLDAQRTGHAGFRRIPCGRRALLRVGAQDGDIYHTATGGLPPASPTYPNCALPTTTLPFSPSAGSATRDIYLHHRPSYHHFSHYLPITARSRALLPRRVCAAAWRAGAAHGQAAAAKEANARAPAEEVARAFAAAPRDAAARTMTLPRRINDHTASR